MNILMIVDDKLSIKFLRLNFLLKRVVKRNSIISEKKEHIQNI